MMGNRARILASNKREAIYHPGNSFSPPDHAASASTAFQNATLQALIIRGYCIDWFTLEIMFFHLPI
jgi:hypothetical protein